MLKHSNHFPGPNNGRCSLMLPSQKTAMIEEAENKKQCIPTAERAPNALPKGMEAALTRGPYLNRTDFIYGTRRSRRPKEHGR